MLMFCFCWTGVLFSMLSLSERAQTGEVKRAFEMIKKDSAANVSLLHKSFNELILNELILNELILNELIVVSVAVKNYSFQM